MVKIYGVRGNNSDQDLRFPQVKAIAGVRNNLNLRQQKAWPFGVPDPRILASQIETVAKANNCLKLLFEAAAQKKQKR
ncbi:MAG TPA: hypothetical protein VL996_15480 [Methylocella sp.]|nr:hypothetical protein [Methylocella sp.]